MTVEAPSTSKGIAKKYSVMGAFLNGVFYALAFVCVLLVMSAIVIPRFMGAVPLTVLTGSMEPTFRPGDLLITTPVEPENVKTGEIITFQPLSGVNTLITHRVISAGISIGGDNVFITRGDANNKNDDPIIGDQVMGKYIYHVPYVGFLANSIPSDNRPVIMYVLGGIFLLWAALQLILLILDIARKKKAKETDDLSTEESNYSSNSTIEKTIT